MIVAGIAALWWVVTFVVFLLSVMGALLQPVIRRRPTSGGTQPPISAILPVKLLNDGFAASQASIFTQAYPDYEVMVATAASDTPALGVMHDLARDTAVSMRFFQARESDAASPKLSTMMPAFLAARHDFLLTKDSNITYAPGSMADLMAHFTDGVGLVCAVPVARRPKSLAGLIEAVLINRDARLLLTVSCFGGGFGVGKTMLFRRADLDRAGGLDALKHTIAEDSALEKGMAAIGLKTVFAREPVDQEIGLRTLAEVYGRQARWAAIRRLEVPLSFPFEPLACLFPAAFAGAIAAPLVGLGALTGFLATLIFYSAAEAAVTAWKRWPLTLWSPVAFIGRDLVLLAAWASAWTTREVVWAGERRAVRVEQRRAETNPAAPGGEISRAPRR